MFASSLLVLLASAGLIQARTVHDARHAHALVHQRAASDDPATATTLSPEAFQSGSANNGLDETGSEAGEAASDTSTNNFINNCVGKTLTNGLQITTGSCNGIPMGDIPAKDLMISSIITFPLPGSATIQSDTTFNITVQTVNLVAGFFTNADATYYAAPQALSGGKVQGHTHVTVQDMGGNFNPTTPLDATQFSFFKGINDPGNGQGLLTATVNGGLPAGFYRVCTLTSASNHQPVLMPVAQRGAQDDCTKFQVIGDGTTINVAANDGSSGLAAAAEAALAVSIGPDVDVTSSSAGAASTAEAAASSSQVDNASATTTAKSTNTANGASGKGGKAVSGGKGNSGGSRTTSAVQVISTTVVQKVTVIETFFEFTLSLGGLPPSVSKQGNQFLVLEELFEDITLACGSACEQQFTTCTSLTGAGFSLEECTSQKESCGSAASSQSSSANPTTITATVTVPPTATVTGSILSETTIATTFTSTNSVAAVVTSSVAAATGDSSGSSGSNGSGDSVDTESVCSLTTSTVFVDPPEQTQVAIVAASSPATTSCGPLSTSTVVVDEAVATSSAESSDNTSAAISQATGTSSAASASGTSTAVSSTSALGGIAAPPVTNSGDATRPFEVQGNTFVNESAAQQRACNVQFNDCADAVNNGSAKGAFTIPDCQIQENECIAAPASVS